MPNWPAPPEPQQYTAPFVARPQVWRKPASRPANDNPPATGVGSSRSTVDPSPTEPTSLSPQQCAAPLAVSPQVWPVKPPAITCVSTRPLRTRTGTGLRWYDPSPNAPNVFSPQQYVA